MQQSFANIHGQLLAIDAQGLYRNRYVVGSAQGVELLVDGRELINFCSNDYLGLANHADVIRAFQSATEQYGVGSGSAHLICGHSKAHHQLEQELADFTGRDRALLFSTGYMVNIGVISALLGRGDGVFEDRLNHASLLDGGLLSGGNFKRYRHNDIFHLQSRLTASAANNKLIVSDGVFSMDGDLAKVSQLAELSKQNGAWLMIDDAHGLGVLGNQGKGILAQYQLDQNDVPVLVGTLGKAFGTFGAFVAGSEDLIELLIHKARSYIYTTALPAAIAAATLKSLQLIKTEQWRRDRLTELVQNFRLGAEQLGLQLMPSSTAIQPLLIGDSQRVLDISQQLLGQGFLVSAIRPPTVGQGSARLRITFSALHTDDQIEHLLNAFDKLKINA